MKYSDIDFAPPAQELVPTLINLSLASGALSLTYPLKVCQPEREQSYKSALVTSKMAAELSQDCSVQSGSCTLMTPLEASVEPEFPLDPHPLCTAAAEQHHPCTEAKLHLTTTNVLKSVIQL